MSPLGSEEGGVGVWRFGSDDNSLHKLANRRLQLLLRGDGDRRRINNIRIGRQTSE